MPKTGGLKHQDLTERIIGILCSLMTTHERQGRRSTQIDTHLWKDQFLPRGPLIFRIQWSANSECFINGSTGMWQVTQSFFEMGHGLPIAALPAWQDKHFGS